MKHSKATEQTDLTPELPPVPEAFAATDTPTATAPNGLALNAYGLPFGDPVFSLPSRNVVVERTGRNGQKTGVTARLMAEISLPLIGGVGDILTAVWRDERFNRDTNAFEDVYSVSLNRNTFRVLDDDAYNAWRQNLLSLYDAWSETPEAQRTINSVRNMTPRLVKTRPAEPTAATPAK
jgi:hypothetical protein